MSKSTKSTKINKSTKDESNKEKSIKDESNKDEHIIESHKKHNKNTLEKEESTFITSNLLSPFLIYLATLKYFLDCNK